MWWRRGRRRAEGPKPPRGRHWSEPPPPPAPTQRFLFMCSSCSSQCRRAAQQNTVPPYASFGVYSFPKDKPPHPVRIRPRPLSGRLRNPDWSRAPMPPLVPPALSYSAAGAPRTPPSLPLSPPRSQHSALHARQHCKTSQCPTMQSHNTTTPGVLTHPEPHAPLPSPPAPYTPSTAALQWIAPDSELQILLQ